MERMVGVGVPGQVGRFRPQQLAQIKTWAGVQDSRTTEAALRYIRVSPKGSSTITQINPLDPGDAADDLLRDIPATDPFDWKVWSGNHG